MTSFAEYTRKKKKKQSAAGKSFDEYTRSILGDAVFEDDIAPVRSDAAKVTVTAKEKEEEKERTWFQKSEGNVAQSILGSATDLVESIGTGIIGMGEKAIDGLMALAPAFEMSQKQMNGQFVTADDWERRFKQEEENQKFIQKDLYDESKIAKNIISAPVKNYTGVDAETMSVFGEKSDSLAQSAGQLGGTIALQAVGLPWWATTGATSLGSEMENASKQGADYAEALMSGLITASAEILTEKLSGGIKFGGKTLDDVTIKPLTEKIANKTVKTLTNVGIDAVGEGTEEVISSVISNLGTSLYKEENIGELLASEEALDEYIESFIGGAVLGGGMSGVNAIRTEKASKNTFTENEQKVVDREIENRLKEKEEAGEKLDNKAKAKIKKDVQNDLLKGNISIDTIESVLGGKTYESYKSINEQESALKKEIEALENMPREQITVKQGERLTEARKQLEELGKTSNKTQLKEQLSKEVDALTGNDTFLRESYNEKARRSQKFEADLTKYDVKQQEVIKKAAESGILNNTRKTHEFVDMIAKISADKGVSFDFTDNQRLKESNFALEGKTVNGYVKDGNVTLNINSNKALNTVVGHEITHVLEGTDLYTELQKAVKEYATTKGEYDTRLQALTKLYEGVDNANIENEITADLVGEYLFTDSDFINKLSTEKPNVFKKIYNEIKYLYKVATAGSKEARELEKVKKAFDKVYKETAASTKYSPSEDAKPTTDTDIHYSLSEDVKTAENYFGTTYKINEAGYLLTDGKFLDFSGKHEGAPGGYRTVDHRDIADAFGGNYGDGSYSGSMIQFMKDGNIRLSPESGGINLSVKPNKAQLSALDRYISNFRGEVILDIDDANGNTVVSVEYPARTYSKRIINDINEYFDNGVVPTQPSTLGQFRYSLSEDSEGKQLSEGQKEYFKDSKIVDDNGQLKVMYHGSPFAFTEFENRPSVNGRVYGDGFYFTESKKQASQWGNGGKIYKTYLNITNPFVVSSTEPVPADVMKALKEQKGKVYDKLSVDSKWWGNKYTKEEFVENEAKEYSDTKKAFTWLDNKTDILKALGYDGIVVMNESTRSDWKGMKYQEVVAFDSKQIKKTTNTKPTRDSDIRHSLGNEAAPTGNYNVYGSDIALEAPIKTTETPVETTQNPVKTTEIPVVETQTEVEEYEYVVDTEAEAEISEMIAKYEKDLAKVNEKIAREDYSFYDRETLIEWRDSLVEDIEKLQLQKSNLPRKKVVKPIAESIPDDYAPLTEAQANERDAMQSDRLYSLDESDMPEEVEAPYYDDALQSVEPESPFDERDIKDVGNRKVNAYMYENPEVKPYFQEEAQNMLYELKNSIKGERNYNDQLYYDSGGDLGWFGTHRQTSEQIAYLLDNFKYTYAQLEKGLNAIIEDHGAENNAVSKRIEFMIDERLREGYVDFMSGYSIPANPDYINLLKDKQINTYSDEAYNQWLETLAQEEAPNHIPEPTKMVEDIAPVKEPEATEPVKNELETQKQKAFEELGDRDSYISKKAYSLYDELSHLQKGVRASEELGYLLDFGYPWKDLKTALLNTRAKPHETVNKNSAIESIVRETLGRDYDSKYEEIAYRNELPEIAPKTENERQLRIDPETGEITEDIPTKTRKELQKALLEKHGGEIETGLDNAKNIPMMLMNNTDTIRLSELVFGRETGRLINDTIFQKAIDNEAHSVRWQNKERAEIKELGIKAGSKESQAVQKYGEGEYVNDKNERIAYGDAELAAEFPDAATRAKIIKASKAIRSKYDNYIDLANQSLTSLGFDPIPKRKDYFRHFQELNDTFTKFGLPFNAQNMQEHVLPTDINGLTEFWSPQKNYFANAKPRKGLKTEYDAIKGIDGYISGISNLIYHTEDIQRGRAFEEMIRNRFGEEHGFDNFDNLTPEEQLERAKKIQDNHLSNYAAWVHEWTNNIAGKKNKIDRAVEAVFGRKAFAFLDETRKQVGSNMIGFNVSSSLTNGISSVQAMSKTNPLAVAKGTADTIKNIFVKDNFIDKNDFLANRMGTDMLAKKPWEKMRDAGYVFMKGMDWFTSNQIVRSKYYELRSKGLSEEKAHAEAGKFAARIMGDRTKGANPQIYNSKLLGLVTQFQLEVNNQLYSMFYDTYQESKEHAKGNALKTAAGMTFTLGAMSALTHVYGQTFEAIAGYNPTFDIIEMIKLALGADDEEEEKTTSERLKAAADKLVDSLPYVNILTGGGRIPVTSGIPNLVGVATGGKDEYGNEMTLEDELKKLLFLVPPTGGNQIKKTTQGLKMFSDEHPVTGSYTDSGNLRFPVEDTPLNRAQAAIFGQWANGNAGEYFDREQAPLKEKQIQEYADLDIPIADYWEYREGLTKQETLEDKFNYIAGLDLPVSKKNIMINNVVDREEDVDLTGYEDFETYEEFDFATKNPEKYDFFQSNNISYQEYNASEESREAYNWAYNNPEKYAFSKAVTDDVTVYRQYKKGLSNLTADKDSEGKTISGSKKEKVLNYINGLDAEYGAKLILFKDEYPADDTYNYEIIEYLNNRNDITYAEMESILKELGFAVEADGTVSW